ncbi:hypothetical protein B5C34_12720 [Pacificimonas flava]|uniref:DUF721 domain-containing protein n=2 Tax=Pacificimonas TaxID=1960290 RepID=A0A219B791_9SPHN|nr:MULTISPECIES: DUF721 domain-containing protein [Pacificimonas]MBZ6378470.1 DUF721 domain-containing protein [Pacificimonas aurantium]OWV34235.1 hypothetical protein B5C34_12720 [Pacificimonas flava]
MTKGSDEKEPGAAPRRGAGKGGRSSGAKAGGKSGFGGRIGHVRTIAELVPRVGRRTFRRFGFVESAVVARWPEIVGAELARITQPDQIRFPQGKRSGGTLCVTVGAARAPHVQHAEPTILEKVNRFFGYGAVARLQLRHGMVDPETVGEHRIATAPRTLDEDERQDLKVIEDDDLRAQLESLAAQISVTKGPPKIS